MRLLPNNRRPLLAAAVAVAALAAGTPIVRGSGFEVPMQGVPAAGQADAFTAQADDPSAIYYNPAGLTQLRGTQFTVGALALFPRWEFDAAAGGGDEVMDAPAVLPHLYVVSDLGTERLRVGLGVFNQFGLSEDWGDDGALRPIVTEAELIVMNISPTVAVRLDDRFSVGAALNIYYADLTLQRKAILGPPPTPEGEFEIDGNDWAVGVTPSFLWRIDERHSVGGFYRSPVTLDLRGEAEVGIPGAPNIGPSDTSVPINIPQQIGLGYAFRPVERLKLEVDAIWTDWNALDRIRIGSDDPTFNDQRIPADWQSGWTFRLGGEYDLTPHWTVRAGYAYSENAVPGATFTPLVPDSDYHLYAVGLGYSRDTWAVDLAYQFIYREERDISGSTLSPFVDGTWENTYHSLMLSATFKM
jgi:long-chain fatty acid transport protein